MQNNERFSIEESLRKMTRPLGPLSSSRTDFHDPLLASFQGVPLSSLIDNELERFYNPAGPVELISRVFRRFRPGA